MRLTSWVAFFILTAMTPDSQSGSRKQKGNTMLDDIEPNDGQTPGAAALEESTYGDIVGKEEDATSQDGALGEKPVETPKEEGTPQDQTQEDPASDPEIEIEVGGKSFKGKQSDLISFLDQGSKISELKRNYDKDYTEKTQALARERKSFEESFGRMPDDDEIKNLGKLYRLYGTDEKARRAIDSILSGEPLDQASNQPKEAEDPNVDPEILALRKELKDLRSLHEKGFQSIQEKEQARTAEQSNRVWNSWTASKKAQGTEITEEIDNAMVPFINALGKKHPDWDDNKLLDESLKRVQIMLDPEGNRKKIVNEVLTDADKAKQGNPPKITPKAAEKSDGEKSYAELLAS